MAEPSGAAPPPGNLLTQLVERVLGYMSAPWKAFVVIVLLVLGGLGYGLWQERARLLDVFTARGPETLKIDVTPELDDLINQAEADIVVVWAIDLDANSVRFVAARKRGGGLWEYRPQRGQAIIGASDPQALAEIIAGRPVCLDLATTVQGLATQRLAADGMRRACFIPIRNQLLLGLLALAWKEPPPPANEAAALGLAAHDADRMIMR